MNGKVVLFSILSAALVGCSVLEVLMGSYILALFTGLVAAWDLFIAFASLDEQPKSN